MSFEIIHKPTFTNQFLAVPPGEWRQITQKIEGLREAPEPDGKTKKKLVGYKGNVYRLRSGDYRILYAYGSGMVTLLGVDNRKDVYRGDQLVAEETKIAAGDIPSVEDILEPERKAEYQKNSSAQKKSEDYLPVKLDPELLTRLRVPDAFIPTLQACETFDDLLNVDIPDPLRERVWDAITSPNLDQVLEQPNFVTGDVDDLLRFAEGELLGFLLKLDPEQEKYVDWAVSAGGPTLVKGGPGTGKSTIGLYRARSLLSSLRNSGVERPRILFTTYTNALVKFSEQLLQRLLGPDHAHVAVTTADSLVHKIVAATDGKPYLADGPALRSAIEESLKTAVFDGNALQRRAQAQTIERLSSDYLTEEILGVIEAREIGSLDQYLSTPRAGRRVPLNNTQRTAVWRVYESLSRALARRNLRTWQGVRQRAAQIARSGGWSDRYDGVIVDEAQDLDPTVLRLLVTLCRTPDRLFVTADANQSIYGSGFRWMDVHEDLRFKGRTGVLRSNHRSTREIGEAAWSYLQAGVLDDPEEEQTYTQAGPLPAVRAVSQPYDETQLLARFLPGAARESRLGIGACAVLVPTEDAGRAVAAHLGEAGLQAVYMPGRELDLERKEIKVLTLKSAKGLEFPVVALAGFLDSPRYGVPRNATSDEVEESILRERRTMYVAMTRAMRALLVVIPAERSHPLFEGFEERCWNTGRGDQ